MQCSLWPQSYTLTAHLFPAMLHAVIPTEVVLHTGGGGNRQPTEVKNIFLYFTYPLSNRMPVDLSLDLNKLHSCCKSGETGQAEKCGMFKWVWLPPNLPPPSPTHPLVFHPTHTTRPSPTYQSWWGFPELLLCTPCFLPFVAVAQHYTTANWLSCCLEGPYTAGMLVPSVQCHNRIGALEQRASCWI